MSRRANDWAWKTDTKGSARLLLLALADFADSGGWVWAQIPMIADRAALSEATVKRQLPGLEGMGLISVLRRRGRGVSLICQVRYPGHDPRPANTAHPELFKAGAGRRGDSGTEGANTAHGAPLNSAKTAHPDEKTAHPVQKNSSSCTFAPYIEPLKEPVSEPREPTPMAFDDTPTVSEVQRSARLVHSIIGQQPRRTTATLTRTVAESLHDGIAEHAIAAGLREWRRAGRTPNSLSGFISEQMRRAPVQAPSFDSPADHVRALWKSGDAATVAKLIGLVWIDPPQPPDDESDAAKWVLDHRRSFVAQHHDAAVSALTAKESRPA